ncbi:MAG: MarR family winged helix-turn-helix transcriptional regulator [Dysgonomonas sp.]
MRNRTQEKELIFDDINFLIWQIMKIWIRGKQRLLDEFGLTASQMEILSAIFHLSQRDQEITQIMISNITHIDPMTTSTILKNFQKKSLITRKLSKTDTRARVVEITNEGRKIFLDAATKIHTSTEMVFSQLDRDVLKEQLQTLLNILTESSNN